MQEKKITEKRNYLDISSTRFVWIEFSKNFHWMWIFINSSFADVFILALFGTHWNYIHTKSIYASANKTHSYDMLCLYFIESFNKKRKKKTQRQIYAKENQSRIICFVFLCIYLLGNFRYLSIVSVYIFLSIWIEMSVLFSCSFTWILRETNSRETNKAAHHNFKLPSKAQ